MRRGYGLWILLISAATITGFSLGPQGQQAARQEPAKMPEAISFRILLGIGDKEPTVWDGKIQAASGRVLAIRGWRLAENDAAQGAAWKISTRRGLPPVGAQNRGLPGAMLENGVIVTAVPDGPSAGFSVETPQGKFSFTPQEVSYGEPKSFLDGRVQVDRVPNSVQLTSSAEEQDFPAAAQTETDVYLAYVEFVHGDRSQTVQGQFPSEPKDFTFLARPAGGDQVMMMRYSKAQRTWDPPVPVSAPKQDVLRAAVAVDGQKRVWVIWSANKDGNFDLYARAYSGGAWSSELRLTSDPGTDINPVAAADAKGRVWVAWQAFRLNNLEILAAAQNGDGFTKETLVSTSRSSDWDPAIASAPNGDVAVSWDTYDKGDYDVYFRRFRWDQDLQMDAPVAVAASQNFEARSSLAYDPQNRLWVAYEASDTKWGKDFGAYETTGIALYQGHNVQLKCFQGARVLTTPAALVEALPGPPGAQNLGRRRSQTQSAGQGSDASSASANQPNAALASNRRPSATPQPPPLPLNSFPRLAVDSKGMVYLAFRTFAGGARTPIGFPWIENVVYFDGAEWRGPALVPQSDGLLDSRPAVLSPAAGTLLLVAATDYRRSPLAGSAGRAGEAINTDLYAAEMRVDASLRTSELKALPAETAAAPHPEVKPELDQVARLRNHRLQLGKEKLQLLRGEFHRHTEMSGDGGRDGPLIDAYRYMIDAAYMDWVGCCDHDNGGGREYYWWTQQKLTDAYKLGQQFIPMFSYERSVRYPEGHRNVVMARRGIRPLPRLPKVPDDAPSAPAPDTQMLYRYLREFGGIAAVHTSATDMGTDWRDNDPIVEPVVEIYQGDRQNYEMPEGPRSNNSQDSIGGWRPLGFVSLALQKGYKIGFQASSDHISTHMSYCNLWVTAPTREAIMDAFRKRRVYGATENILADVRCGEHFMGEEFSTSAPPAISVKLAGTANFAKVHIVKDNQYVYSTEPGTKTVDFVWKDAAAEKGKTSFYYVRGEQTDGELVWVSPMWITYR